MHGAAGPIQVAVIGGGFCGAFYAAQLARHATVPIEISIIEPRPMLGGGVAYSSTDPAHRTNVPATRMTLFPDDPTHFNQWLRRGVELHTDPAAIWHDGLAYPRRGAFGRYVAQLVAEQRDAKPGISIEHFRDKAIAVDRDGRSYRVSLAGGSQLTADLVVLATSHPPPALPAMIARQLGGDPGLIANPWAPDALDNVAPDADVLIVGVGLTMADVVASLTRRGHTGRITAFSRRGLLPRGHAKQPAPVPCDWFATHIIPPNAAALVRQARLLIAAAARDGLPWQAVFDDIRANGQKIWRGLNEAERRRFLRHIRVFWDAHRYRIAPQIEAVLQDRRQDGSLRVLAASLRAAHREGGKINVTLHPRHTPPDTVEQLAVDRVIVTTGPSHGTIVTQIPVLQSLADQGLLQPDRLGLGLAVDALGQAVRADGTSEPTLLVIGPLAREQYGELMGMPQVAAQPNAVAEHSARLFATRVLESRAAPAIGELSPQT